MPEKVALITGAARGIGLETARLFIEQGWRVALVDRDSEALKDATDGLNETSSFICDISEPKEVDSMVNKVTSTFGRIDAVVNNAGVADFGPIETTDFAQWRKIMQTNLDGTFLVSQACLRYFEKNARRNRKHCFDFWITCFNLKSGVRHIQGRGNSANQTNKL